MPKTLTIIGMGAVGVAAFAETVARLRYDPGNRLTIKLVERDTALGRGLAFGTDQKGHLLNTESRLMGLYDQEPDHFRTWLDERRAAAGEPIAPDAVNYVQRREYRMYMQDVLATAFADADAADIAVEIHHGEATAIDEREGGFVVRMADGTDFPSDFTLMAIGTPQAERFRNLDGAAGYFDSPYPSDRLIKEIERDQDVVILGSGLSAIDTVMSLLDVDHHGRINLISKDGMLPHVEIPRPETGYDCRHLTLANVHRLIRKRGPKFSVVDLVRLFRREAEEAVGRPIDWAAEDRFAGDAKVALERDIVAAEAGNEPFQRILTSGRHEATMIWNLLSEKDQLRFSKWLAPHFATARYAMPMVNARRIAAAMQRGLLTVRGNVGRTERNAEGEGFVVRFEDGPTFAASVVINATGTATRLEEMKEPLIHDLIQKGWLQSHPMGGARAHRATCRTMSAKGDGPCLYGVGQILGGELHDTNAVWFNVACAARAVDDILRQR
ncbi:FAD/NAD(P)-binding protein [Sphingomonas faeni]|uniref:FAD/NAD(P)-binding protein n=1 Tax=Sphingomonas faeni TaxID=185950 RepID=UPI00241391E5|nr:FAD/NAD(P)-binding protein [Sphingomonas faeni]